MSSIQRDNDGIIATSANKDNNSLSSNEKIPHGVETVPHSSTPPPTYLDKEDDFYTDECDGPEPTEEELVTLRRVSDKIPWLAYTVAFVELVERMSFYGTTIVFTTFLQLPLPDGSIYGNAVGGSQSGALGKGPQTAAGLVTFNQFWAYFMPLFGAWLSDKYLGRFKTICIGVGIAIVGHAILTGSGSAQLLTTNPNGSMALFIVGIIVMGVGTGFFKPNISPLVVEQLKNQRKHVKVLPTGEKVIVDPQATISRVYMYFYLFINLGALAGQLSMSYAAQQVGFYLAYLIPTAMFTVLCPLVLFFCRNKYKKTPPAGSILGRSIKLLLLGTKGRWHFNPIATYKHMNDGTFWEAIKPSRYTDATRPKWMTFDDAWVSEVGRGWAACSVFLWYPLYWLAYNQINNNLTAQATTMTLNGLPAPVTSNLDPLALIIFIPIMDLVIYPLLRRNKINFSPIKRIYFGFFTGAASMVWAAVVQYYIYQTHPCGYQAYSCPDKASPLNVWIQTGAYVLLALSEIFASITSLEYAYTKAPKNMRSLVQAFSLFMTALAAAIGEAFVPLTNDPLLTWNYGIVAILAAVGGTIFAFQYRSLDKAEDHLNMLKNGHVYNNVDAPAAVLEEALARDAAIRNNSVVGHEKTFA